MACKNCSPKTFGVCEVCKLIEGDTKTKEVRYCETCKAWICSTCDPDMWKRAKAMVKNTTKKLKAKIKVHL